MEKNMSIGSSEKLSEAVRRFPCLYEKTNKLYKYKNVNGKKCKNVKIEALALIKRVTTHL